jgi:hypothetical protein
MMSHAAEAGINFFDSAEMYPVPQRAETQGASEEILGRWLRLHPRRRAECVVATKIAGPGAMDWLRGGPASLDADNIAMAIDGSLRRLGVDCIDLIQLHWPDRCCVWKGCVCTGRGWGARGCVGDAKCCFDNTMTSPAHPTQPLSPLVLPTPHASPPYAGTYPCLVTLTMTPPPPTPPPP